MFKSKKGFTLVELLAVIVILAIILAIAIPGIAGIINSAKKGAFESDAKMLVTGIEYKTLESSTDPSVTAPTSSATAITNVTDYGADSANYDNVYIINTNPVTICVESAASSKFGAFMATATRATVKYLDTYTPTYASCADYIAANPVE
jgi:type IV pilus assembly protein PilA